MLVRDGHTPELFLVHCLYHEGLLDPWGPTALFLRCILR